MLSGVAMSPAGAGVVIKWCCSGRQMASGSGGALQGGDTVGVNAGEDRGVWRAGGQCLWGGERRDAIEVRREMLWGVKKSLWGDALRWWEGRQRGD